MGESTTEERRFTGLLPDLLRVPVTGITCIGAIVLTIMWWTTIGAESLLLDSSAFESQPWRLITSTLLHANALHLFFNLYWTWRFGTIVESRIGHWKTAALYLLLASVPAAAEFAVFTGGVGLSGLVYGLFGFLWILGSRDPKWAGVIDRRTIQTFVIWFFLCVVLTLTNVMPIGNMAHAAGWGLGALIGRMAAAAAVTRLRWIMAIASSVVAVDFAASIARPYINRTGAVERDLAHQGYVALKSGQNARAVGLFRQALARDAKHSDWWLDLGAAYWNLDSTAESIDAIDHAARLNPDDPDVRASQSVCKFRLAYKANEEGRLSDAIALYEASVALDGTDPSAWYNLGVAYQSAKRYDEAIKAYEHSLRLDSSKRDARAALDDLRRWMH
jgi:membrane associated rhomboid family serine protease/Tfp pilus assembly protein PilF